MNLISRFKKDYFNYLISVILPALIGGISVPVFKYLLGAGDYGTFAIYLNAAFLCASISTGWVSQSVYRFYPDAENKFRFSRIALNLSLKTQLIIFLPVIFFFWYTKNDFLVGLIICIAIFFNSRQIVHMSIAQSCFLSRKNILSEFIRSTSYISVAVLLLLLFPKHYLTVLFIALALSYFLSSWYLHRQSYPILIQTRQKLDKDILPKKIIKKFMIYGGPLSLWLVFAYLIPYIDKLWMKYQLGSEAQGNYQAMFDLLSKGLTLLISPITISLLPLLTRAFTDNQHKDIRTLMTKIISLELGAMVISGILYWWFGYVLLFKLLNIPNTSSFKIMGLIIIAGTFIWQLAILIQQKYILKLMTRFLLFMVIITVCFQIGFYWIMHPSNDPLIYAWGYLLASLLYLILIALPFLRNKFIKGI